MDSDDENDLFRQAMADAKPLKTDRIYNEAHKPAPTARFTRKDQQAVLAESLQCDTAQLANTDEMQFCRAGLKSPFFKKLKRGVYTVEEELDLHGLTVVEARGAIKEFLREAKYYRWSCVRIIHGKGKRSWQGVPVLRPQVSRWLRLCDQVLAFCSALPRDGGSGAVYVLLAN